jgi:hypothetical protein
MNSNIDRRKQKFLKALTELYGIPACIGEARYSREQCIDALVATHKASEYDNYTTLPAWLVNDKTRRLGRALYSIPEAVVLEIVLAAEKIESSDEDCLTEPETCDTMSSMNSNTFNLVAPSSDVSLVPMKNDTFVPWGHHDDISTILKSKQFAPVYITGMSGNGKTTMVEQICASSGRECIRVNITAETDEDDLIGGFRLINGETKFVFRPCSVARSSCWTRSTSARSA